MLQLEAILNDALVKAYPDEENDDARVSIADILGSSPPPRKTAVGAGESAAATVETALEGLNLEV